MVAGRLDVDAQLTLPRDADRPLGPVDVRLREVVPAIANRALHPKVHGTISPLRS